jgi:hypothetical protein
MKLYLDVCCLNRPFDDQSQTRVRLEAEAILSILQMAQSDKIEIIGSDIIDDELSQMPDNERREKLGCFFAGFIAHFADTGKRTARCRIAKMEHRPAGRLAFGVGGKRARGLFFDNGRRFASPGKTRRTQS